MADWTRIAKLTRMFSTSSDGERLASVSALERVLVAESLTFNDLADRLTAVDTLQIALNNACRDVERLRAEVAGLRQAAVQSFYGQQLYPNYLNQQMQAARQTASDLDNAHAAGARVVEDSIIDRPLAGQPTSSRFADILRRATRK